MTKSIKIYKQKILLYNNGELQIYKEKNLSAFLYPREKSCSNNHILNNFKTWRKSFVFEFQLYKKLVKYLKFVFWLVAECRCSSS